MEKYKVLKLNKEDLEKSIEGLSQLKPILQKSIISKNGTNEKQGIENARELGEHFDTAINAMITVLAYIKAQKINKS